MKLPPNTATTIIDGRECITGPAAAAVLRITNETLGALRCKANSSGIDHPEYIKHAGRIYYPIAELEAYIQRTYGGCDLVPQRSRMDDKGQDAEFLTARQLMARWQMGRTKFYELIKDPNFPRPLVIGSRKLYAIADIVAYEAPKYADKGREAA